METAYPTADSNQGVDLRFAGYGRPNYTGIPDIFLDEQMQDLTEAELKVMLYIFRRTYGFKKSQDAISHQQFLEGIITKDGRQLDRGAGISERSLKTALKNLEEKGYIFRHERRYSKIGSLPTLYELNIDGYPHYTDTHQEKEKLLGKTKTNRAEVQILHRRGDVDFAPEGSADFAPEGSADFIPHKKQYPKNSTQKTVPPPEKEIGGDSRIGKKESSKKLTLDLADLVEEDAKYIAQKLNVDIITAENIAMEAGMEGNHISGYIQEVVNYVISNPTIKNPVGALRVILRSGERRVLVGNSAKKVQPDFSKYLPRPKSTTFDNLPVSDYSTNLELTESIPMSSEQILSIEDVRASLQELDSQVARNLRKFKLHPDSFFEAWFFHPAVLPDTEAWLPVLQRFCPSIEKVEIRI